MLITACSTLFSQNRIILSIQDELSVEPLLGVNLYIPELDLGAVSDDQGMAQIDDVPDGIYQLEVSYVGYESQTIELTVSGTADPIVIALRTNVSELGEVIITSNRANRSIANIPSRIEVLTDEVEEAATMDPSKIAHLLMHTTGVQVQQTSATTGSASVRIQGQYGRYTQILKDGFPIYGGFTGGLGVLQIPPLDLRQVEFVKGSASTLYGGGSIAGLINLVSKKPS